MKIDILVLNCKGKRKIERIDILLPFTRNFPGLEWDKEWTGGRNGLEIHDFGLYTHSFVEQGLENH